MDIIGYPRGAGKTTLLLDKLEKNRNSILVVRNSYHKRYLISNFKKHHLENKVVSVSSLSSLQGSLSLRENPNIYIDDIDLILCDLLKLQNITLATFTTGYNNNVRDLIGD